MGEKLEEISWLDSTVIAPRRTVESRKKGTVRKEKNQWKEYVHAWVCVGVCVCARKHVRKQEYGAGKEQGMIRFGQNRRPLWRKSGRAAEELGLGSLSSE